MRLFPWIDLLGVLIFLNIACKDSTSNVTIPRDFSELVQYSSDASWVLSNAFFADTVVDLNRYKQFDMSFNDSIIHGFDGCNFYYTRYEIVHDSVVIPFVSVTQVGCNGLREFNACLFVNHWKVIPGVDIITFISEHEYFQFQRASM